MRPQAALWAPIGAKISTYAATGRFKEAYGPPLIQTMRPIWPHM